MTNTDRALVVSATSHGSTMTAAAAKFQVVAASEAVHQFAADVVLLHGCPQSGVPNPVEGLLESMKTW